MQNRNDIDLSIRFVEVNGQRLRVAETKRGSEKPLLLFNGIGGNIETAMNFIKALDRTDIIIFDIPTGQSCRPASRQIGL